MFRLSLRMLFAVTSVFCVYFGAYAALLQPVDVVDDGMHGMVIDGYREPSFKIGGDAALLLFSPPIWLDRSIRPTFWDHFSDLDSAKEPAQ